ncbi:TerD family protein [Peptoanaerobacter stomatis]
MKYEILYKGAFPLIRAILSQGEMIKAESDAMVSMSSTVDVEGSMEGEDFSIETAVVVGELYRYQGEWKFSAIGSGFQGGLAALCKNFGLEV